MTTYNIEQYQGDTWEGATITILVNSVPVDLTDAEYLMDVRTDRASDSLLTLTLGHGISEVDPTAGIFSIDSQIFPMPAGVYKYDIQITFPNGFVKTYVRGQITIQGDISWPTPLP